MCDSNDCPKDYVPSDNHVNIPKVDFPQTLGTVEQLWIEVQVLKNQNKILKQKLNQVGNHCFPFWKDVEL